MLYILRHDIACLKLSVFAVCRVSYGTCVLNALLIDCYSKKMLTYLD